MNLPPWAGWLAILVLALGFDFANRITLSTYAQHHRVATFVVGTVVLAHLLGVLPRQVDPFEWLASLVNR